MKSYKTRVTHLKGEKGVKDINILIARDQSLFCEAISGLVEKESAFHIIGNAEGRVQLMEDLGGSPDVVILCSPLFAPEEIPDMIQDIKKKRPDVRVLIILEEEMPDDALMHILMLGADGYLMRSATSGQLAEAIRAIYAGRVWAERSLLSKFVKAPVLNMDVEEKLTQVKEPLTKREKEITSLLFLGLSNKTIADRLFISEKTVKTHLNSIFRKLKVKNRSQVLAFLIHSD